jgi:hypothetical protein
MKIPEWKWEEVGMDFIVGLPRTQKGYGSIWVIVDRLIKVAHIIPVKTTYSGAKLAELYMERIVCLHGYQRRLFLIEVCSLCLIFGRSCMSPWTQN